GRPHRASPPLPASVGLDRQARPPDGPSPTSLSLLPRLVPAIVIDRARFLPPSPLWSRGRRAPDDRPAHRANRPAAIHEHARPLSALRRWQPDPRPLPPRLCRGARRPLPPHLSVRGPLGPGVVRRTGPGSRPDRGG